MKKQFLETGKIVSTHGIKGEVKIYPWCDEPEFITDFDVLYLDNHGQSTLEILSSRIHKGMVIAFIKGYDSIEKSNELKNKILYVDRNDIEMDEGDYFLQDIIGMTVIDVDTEQVYGILSDYSDTGAHRNYHIKCDNSAKELLFPAIEDLVIIDVNLDTNIMKIRPMEGLFDDEI